MIERSSSPAAALVSTGLDRLDEALGGGVPRSSLVAVAGVPGAGKSVLVFHMLARQARLGNSTVYLTTTHQPVSKVRAQYGTLNFLSHEGLMDRIGMRGLDPQPGAAGLSTILNVLLGLIVERQCQLVVIDSFRAIADTAQSKSEIWQFLGLLSEELVKADCVGVVVGEYELPKDLTMPEFAVADSIIGLDIQRDGSSDKRAMRVYKVRGAQSAGGSLEFSIAADGIQFP